MKEMWPEEEKSELQQKGPTVLCGFVLQLLVIDKAWCSKDIKACHEVKNKEKLDKEREREKKKW
jgi:hypothetical protein